MAATPPPPPSPPAATGDLLQPTLAVPVAAAPAVIPEQAAAIGVVADGLPIRGVSETSDLSSLDGEPAAAGGLPPVAAEPADAASPPGLGGALGSATDEPAPFPSAGANDTRSSNGTQPDVLIEGPTPSNASSSAASAANTVTAASPPPPPPPPPAPRSLSSALSSPGSPAASNSSDPTADTEPLAGSPRDDEDEDEDEPAAVAEDEDDEMEGDVVVDSPAARRRRRQQQRGVRKPPVAVIRAPSAPPAVKSVPAAVPTLAVRAATASPKTALEKVKETGGSGVKVGQANLWKADEEGDSDLTPDEDSDVDEQPETAARLSHPSTGSADEEDDDDDRMDVDPSPSKTRNGVKVTTPRASAKVNTPTAGQIALADADEDDEDESEGQSMRPKRSTRTQQRTSRKVFASEDEDEDEAESDPSDDDDDDGNDQPTPKKAPATASSAPGRSPSSALKSAPRTVNGELPSARAPSPVVPQSEELSPPPTSPSQSNADEDDDEEDDEDEAADDETEVGKTPTKAVKPDVRFNLMGAGAGAGEPFQEDEEVEDDDEDEDGAATTPATNGDLPEVRIEEPPTEGAAAAAAEAEAAEAETAQAEADEAALPDTPQLSGGESTFPIALNLQAQQRLDAMEALSKIEIAFARLRDLMHVERMEECAREEEKLLNDTHPLLTQVQTRLTALRDRELSSIEARHVVATAESALVEKADVSGIWEWWRNGREELQRDMMADVMRKRRRVDREKRAVEGGRPKRPLPAAPPGPPPPRMVPVLEDLLPASLLNYRPEEKRKMREEREAWGPRPGLLGLDERGRDNDLDLLGIGPSTRYHQHQAQMFRPFDGHGPPMMGGPPMHHPHHVMQNQPPQPYHTLQPHAYAPPPPPPPHPADGVYLQQNRPPYPYRPPIMPPYQADGHLQNGPHPPQIALHPHHAGHPPHQGQPGPPPPPPAHHMSGSGLQPAFGEAYGKPPGSSVVIGRPAPGSGGHHATGRAIMPSSSLPSNGVGPAGPEVGHASYASFDMAFGGGGSSGAGPGVSSAPGGAPYGHAPNGPPGAIDAASPHKRARTGSPVGFRTLGIV